MTDRAPRPEGMSEERLEAIASALEAIAARSALTPPGWRDGKCVNCGAPQLKEGERHAVLLPVRSAQPFYATTDDNEPAQPQGWQPIETAPHVNGETVLLWWPYWNHHHAMTGYWGYDRRWHAAQALEGDYVGPTHWQPLPSPPAQDGGTK